MKYQLIKPINESLSARQQILTNRGIKLEDIQHFLNTTDNDINEPEKFGEENLKAAARTLVQTIQNNQNGIVIIDADCDGFTSAALLINYLYDVFPSWSYDHLSWYLHKGKQHGLNDCISYILGNEVKYNLVFCPDSSSNDYKEHKKLKEYNINTIVLDHHEAEKISEDAIVINNQLSDYPNKDLSGVGVTWQFCRYIDSLLKIDKANNYLDLVALGDCADMMSMTSFETKHLITKGILDENIKNPFIAYMAEKNSFSLKGKLTPIGIAFYIAPFVNAIVRSGTMEEKDLIFCSMLKHIAFKMIDSTKRGHSFGEKEKLVEQAVRVATNVKARQTKAQNEGMEVLENMIKEQQLLNHKVLLFLLEPGQIDKNIAGLAANKIMAKYQRPVCVLTKAELNISEVPWQEDIRTVYQGSARGCDRTGINNFKDICESTGETSFLAGHQGAFGISLIEENVPAFIEKTDEILKGTNDEAVYYVDYIYQEDNIQPQNILTIAEMDDLWGKDIEEAYIAVENIKIVPEMVTVYDKKGYTIKISLPNDISAMIFNATELDVEKLQTNNTGYVEINLVGKCNKNEWMGMITPQIFIEEYEIIDSNKYYF